MSEPAPSPPLDQSPTLTCPRCGYDQAGQAARFTDSCPLSGLCTECGLTFAWSDVYFPSRRLAKTFEHAERQHFRVWANTVFECILTPRLFKRLRMHQPINATRLTIYALSLWSFPPLVSLACAVINDVFGLSWNTVLFSVRRSSLFMLQGVSEPSFFDRLWRVLVPVSFYEDYGIYPPEMFACVLLWILLTPMCFPILRQTLQRTRVRNAHLARLGVYASTGLVMVICLQFILDWLLRWMHWNVVLFDDTLWSFSEHGWFALSLLFTWQVWFWSWAGQRYLKLPRAVPIALAMTVIGGLLTAALCTLTFGWSVLLRVVPV